MKEHDGLAGAGDLILDGAVGRLGKPRLPGPGHLTAEQPRNGRAVTPRSGPATTLIPRRKFE